MFKRFLLFFDYNSVLYLCTGCIMVIGKERKICELISSYKLVCWDPESFQQEI